MTQQYVRFAFWLIGVLLVGAGVWQVSIGAALIVVGAIILGQVVVSEVIDMYRMHNVRPAQSRRTNAK